MPIYDLSGESLTTVFDNTGRQASQAYDIEGNPLLGTRRIKVATYNVGQWFVGGHDNVPADRDAEYYQLQNEIISNLDADILLLEEYVDQFSKTGRTAYSLLSQYYPYIEARGGGSVTTVDGRCICSKYPISNYTVRVYSTGGKYYDSCNITIDGFVFTVFVTHAHWSTDSPDNYRISQMQELANVSSQYSNVIIGGDFNTGISANNTPEQVAQKISWYVQPLLDLGYHTANYSTDGILTTCYDGTDTTATSWALDTIYTSPNLPLSDVYVETTKLTDGLADKIDHLPIAATVIY